MRTNGRRRNGDGQLFADLLTPRWSSFRLSKTTITVSVHAARHEQPELVGERAAWRVGVDATATHGKGVPVAWRQVAHHRAAGKVQVVENNFSGTRRAARKILPRAGRRFARIVERGVLVDRRPTER